MYIQVPEIEALYQNILDYDTIIIHRHVRPDPDALGSQLGLKRMIQSKFPQKRVLAAGTTSQGLAWLGEMDKVRPEDYLGALVIITDTANLPRVDGEHYDQGAALVKIDHHPLVDNYGDLALVYPEASSASEMIALIGLYLAERLPLDEVSAQLLYAGIVGDTGRFKYDATTATTFRVAAHLAEFGIDMFQVNDRFSLISSAQAKFQGYAYDNLVINEAGVASLVITRQDMMKFNISEEETNSVVSLPGQIEGVLVWVIFIEQLGDSIAWRCRIRSKGPVINQVAENYHGGGHPKASGAKAYNQTEVEALLADLTEVSASYQSSILEIN